MMHINAWQFTTNCQITLNLTWVTYRAFRFCRYIIHILWSWDSVDLVINLRILPKDWDFFCKSDIFSYFCPSWFEWNCCKNHRKIMIIYTRLLSFGKYFFFKGCSHLKTATSFPFLVLPVKPMLKVTFLLTSAEQGKIKRLIRLSEF